MGEKIYRLLLGKGYTTKWYEKSQEEREKLVAWMNERRKEAGYKSDSWMQVEVVFGAHGLVSSRGVSRYRIRAKIHLSPLGQGLAPIL